MQPLLLPRQCSAAEVALPREGAGGTPWAPIVDRRSSFKPGARAPPPRGGCSRVSAAPAVPCSAKCALRRRAGLRPRTACVHVAAPEQQRWLGTIAARRTCSPAQPWPAGRLVGPRARPGPLAQPRALYLAPPRPRATGCCASGGTRCAARLPADADQRSARAPLPPGAKPQLPRPASTPRRAVRCRNGNCRRRRATGVCRRFVGSCCSSHRARATPSDSAGPPNRLCARCAGAEATHCPSAGRRLRVLCVSCRRHGIAQQRRMLQRVVHAGCRRRQGSLCGVSNCRKVCCDRYVLADHHVADACWWTMPAAAPASRLAPQYCCWHAHKAPLVYAVGCLRRSSAPGVAGCVLAAPLRALVAAATAAGRRRRSFTACAS